MGAATRGERPMTRRKNKHDTRPGLIRRRNRCAEQFTAYPLEVLESWPWRVLTLAGHRVIDRVCIELCHHGGFQANGLCVPYNHFEEYGIERHGIGPAIREAVALGFLKIVRAGRGGNREFRKSALYQTTFLPTQDTEASHDWHRIATIEEARAIAAEARKPKPRQQQKRTVLQFIKAPDKKQKTGAGNPPASVWETPPKTAKFAGETPTIVVGETPPLSTSGGGRSGDGTAARFTRHGHPAGGQDRAGVGPRPTPRPRVPLRTGTRPRVPLLEPEQQ